MQVIISKTETQAMVSQLEVILPMAYELMELREAHRDSAETVFNGFLVMLDAEENDGQVTINIPEEKIVEYFDIVGSMYQLAFKVAKIVKPTVEVLMSDCKEDFFALFKKIL